MKRFSCLLIFALALTTSFNVEAKKEKNGDNVLSAEEQIKILNDSLNIYRGKVQALNEIIRSQGAGGNMAQSAAQGSALNDSLAAARQESAQLKQTILLNNQRLDSLAAVNDSLLKSLAEVDILKAKLANSRLLIPYNPEMVAQAVEVFNSIQDPEVKKQYGAILDLLKTYPTAIRQTKELLESLEYSGDKSSLTKYDDDLLQKWKNSSLSKIKNNPFYKKCISENFKIYYLYNIIEEAQLRVKNTTQPNQIPDFNDLKFRLDPYRQ